MAKIRILLVEDNRILRDGITALLDKEKDFTVTGLCDGGRDVVAMASNVKPHVVLLDLGLESQNSLEIVENLKKEFPGIKIIGMGLAPSQTDIVECVQAGADGFILKDAKVEDVIYTIREVAAGRTVLPNTMTASLFFQVAEHALLRGNKNLKGAIRMTEREKEIIALITDGMSNKQIAVRLNIATFTVKSHVHNMLEKLELHSRLQIASYSRDEETSNPRTDRPSQK
jgi:two-component system nitrate/nitrite response regulator NarL